MFDFPTNPKVAFIKQYSLETFDYTLFHILLASHSGTHIDAPSHSLEDGETVDEIDLEKVVGEALVIKLEGKNRGSKITIEDLKPYEKKIEEIKRVILCTEWDKRFGSMGYFREFPSITLETAEWLVSKGVKMVGMDLPSPNAYDHRGSHVAFFNGGVILVEGLKNLKNIKVEKVFFLALPLRMKGIDASPVRAIAIEEQP